MPIIGILFLSFLIIVLYVKYIISNDKIIIKYPFLHGKEYLLNNIVGYESQRIQAENQFIIYFNNKQKIKMEVSGKKLEELIKIFSEKYYKIIVDKNIETIKTNGFEVNIRRNKLVFFSNRVEVIGKINKIYYYDKDIENFTYFEIINQFKRLDILTKDKYLIKLLSDKCMGGLGLFEYLNDIVKCHNDT
jgi:biotin operon repressor